MIAAQRLALAVAFVAVSAVALPLGAQAHARYKSSTPGRGEVVHTSPPQVSITFTQEIQKVAGTYDIHVAKDRGPSVTSGPAAISETDRTMMSVPLQPRLPAGRYVVTFKNVSDADGDPFGCSLSFYVQTPPTAVDRANDAQLAASCSAGETPTAATPGAGQTAVPGTPARESVTAAAPTQAPTPQPTADAGSGGGSNTGRNIGIAVAVAAAFVVVGGGGLFLARRGR